MLRFEGREEDLALPATRLDGGRGRSNGNVALGGASSWMGEWRKGEEGRLERLTRHVLPDKASECAC